MIQLEPVGFVRGGRAEPMDDNWGLVTARIELNQDPFTPESLAGLDAFSHVQVIFYFHLVPESKIEWSARRPRGRQDWPVVGIFAQRGKDRPNRLGVTICRLQKIEGLTLHVQGLDALDGTPVLDVKSYYDRLRAARRHFRTTLGQGAHGPLLVITP